MDTGKVRYQRNLKNTYLVIKEAEKECLEEYAGKMVLQNKISGLACCEIRNVDERKEIWYEITSLQALEQIYAVQKISGNTLKDILRQIYRVTLELEKYLLDGKRLCFEPEYFFWNREENRAVFLYDFEKSDAGGMQKLAEFLIERVDYNENETVELAYYFYDRAIQENFSIEEVMRYIDKNKKGEIKEEIKEKRKDWEEEKGREEDKNMEKEILNERTEKETWKEKTKEKRRKQNFLPGIGLMGIGIAGIATKQLMELFFLLTEREKMLCHILVGIFFFMGMVFFFSEAVKEIKKKRRKEEKEEKEEKQADIGKTENMVFVEKLDFKEKEPSEKEISTKTIYLGEEIKKRKRHLVSGKKGKETEYEMEKFPFIVGKEKEKVNLFIKEHSASRIHARFIEREGDIYLEDLHSTNGTYVNDLLLEPHEPVRVKSGDILCFGKAEFRYY